MVRRFGYASFALFAALSVAGTARAQTPPPADAPPPEAPPPAADAPVAAPPVAVPVVETPPPPAPPPPPPAPSASSSPFAPFKIDASGNSIRIGLLFQPAYRTATSATQGVDGLSQNLFLRRTRILVGGTLFGKIDYFLDTDYPNLFLATPEGNPNAMTDPTPYTNNKGGPGMYIQDAFITARPIEGEFKDAFKIDAGFMLPPMAHNAVQGAGTLYSLDYYANSFLHSNVFGGTAPVGRDLGVQLRGLLAGGLVEYRVGLFQGLRQPQTDDRIASHNFFRATGRVQINLLDAESGFFYSGTYLGAKKVLSIGGSADIQGDYKYFAGDVFTDMPMGPGVFTLQANYAHWNGDGFVNLPKEWAVMGEVGYNFNAMINPLVRAEYLDATSTTGAVTKTARYGGGINWWPYGHNMNLKTLYQYVKVDGAPKAVNQIDLQWQLYFY